MKPIHSISSAVTLLTAACLLCGCEYMPEIRPYIKPEQTTAAVSGTTAQTQETTTQPAADLIDPINESNALYQSIVNALQNFQDTVVLDYKPETGYVSEICRQIRIKHPEWFWFEGCFSMESDSHSAELKLRMPSSAEQQKYLDMTQALTDAADAVIADIPENASNYEKALAVHDYITGNTTYDKNTEYAHSPYGCLVEHTACCEGYSKAFLLLMNRLHIPAGLCSGQTNGNGHMWNYIYLDGKYYWVDVTWDDPISASPDKDLSNHAFCFVNDDLLLKTHTPDPKQIIPKCSSMDMNYFVQNGTYFSSYDFGTVSAAITAQLDAPYIEMMFGSDAESAAAVEDLFTNNQFWEIKDLPEDKRSCSYSQDDETPMLRIELTESES